MLPSPLTKLTNITPVIRSVLAVWQGRTLLENIKDRPSHTRGTNLYYSKLFTTTIVSLFTLLFILPTKAHAQTTSLAIWPPILEATVQPGKTITQVYRLKNLGNDTTITANIVPFSPNNELGHVTLELNKTSPPFFSLLNANLDKSLPTTFDIKAGQTQEIVLKVKIPESTPEADHYLTFLFSSSTTGLVNNTGLTTQGSIGSNILLTISRDGNPIKTAKIEEFAVGQRSVLAEWQGRTLPENSRLRTSNLLDSFSPISFLLRVKNTGNTKFKSIGQIEIKNTFKKSIATLPLREDNILANSVRSLTSGDTPGVKDGDTPGVKEVHTPGVEWSSTFPLGLYTATATITPQDSNLPISSTINFLVLPYKSILVILTLFITYKYLTKFSKHKTMKT